MKYNKGKAQLFASAATMAVITGWANPVAAQCVTDTATVTCTGTVTAATVNAAANSVTPPSVTVRVAADASVVAPTSAIQPSSTFTGTVDVGNAGTLGTAAAPVGVRYFGTPDSTTNIVSVANGGTVTGGVVVTNVGGAITATNTGTIAGGVQLTGSGAITLTSSGPIYVAGSGAGATAVFLQSQRSVDTTTGTPGVDALTTRAVTAGAVNAVISAPISVPAAGTAPAVPQAIQIASVGRGGSAQLTLDTAAGAVVVRTNGVTDSTFIPGTNVTTANGTTTSRSSSAFSDTGGAAAATLGANAQVASLSVQGGSGGAAATIAGTVGTIAAPGSVDVRASGTTSNNTSETVSTATDSTTRTTSSFTPTGGAATLDIAATGSVVGNVTVSSNVSDASANLAGAIGASNDTTVAGGSLTANARGSGSTSSSTFTNAGTAFSSNSSSTVTASTGAASASVADTGRVLGSVNAFASGGAATASVAGTVGSSTGTIVPGSVTADSRGSNSIQSDTFAQVANGDTSSSFQQTQTSVGRAATTSIAASASVAGNAVALSNAGDAIVEVAGTVGAGQGTTITVQGNVLAQSNGTNSTQSNSSSNVAANGDNTFTDSRSEALSGGAARATVASTGAVFGNVGAYGDRGASIDNAGRVRDFAQARSVRDVTLSTSNTGSRVTSTDTAGVTTVVTRSTDASVSQTNGGAADITNRTGGVIEDGAFVSGVAGATFTNAGAIFGNVDVSSSGRRTENSGSFNQTQTTTPATGGGATQRSEFSTSRTNIDAPVGGMATGTYGGTIGAAAGSPLAFGTQVTQSGQAGSTATVSGTLYADMSTSAGATRFESASSSTGLNVSQPFTGTATPAGEFTGSSTSRSSSTNVAANNTVTVTGALRNNSYGTGDLSAFTLAGTTAVAIDGGIVEGNVTATSSGIDSTSGSDSSFRDTQAATASGPSAPVVAQSRTSSSFSEQRRVAGTASVALTGNARVDGSVQVTGTGTGAGPVGASAAVASTAVIRGGLSVTTGGTADTRTESSSVQTRTGATATTRTDRFSQTASIPQAVGNSTASVAGTIGGPLSVSAPFSNASATLSGQVLNGAGVSVTSYGSLFSSSSEQSYRGTSATSLATPIRTGSTSQSTTTATGGTAALTIASAGATATNGLSAVNGDIQVIGTGGSALTIAAGTRVLATNAGDIFVGSGNSNFAQSSTSTFNATGGQTGQVSTFSNTAVGGPATISNAGIIGSSTGYFGAPNSVGASSVGGGAITNSGTIYGDVYADALFSNSSTTTTRTGLTDAVTQQSVSVTTRTLVGGAATITNGGVISGNASLAGATGTLTNTGVIRNGATLGRGDYAGTYTSTQNATTNTYAETAPATRFAQTYTLSQNGLLLNGITVTGATVPDFSTGAAANATLRTSDVRATVNLGNGSVTSGNITAQVDRANARLTDTTVNLSGTGYLGVGTGQTPPATLGVGAGPLRYENAPDYARFASIDPALGNSASGTFQPSVGIASGTRISGVNLVDRSGAGVFTIVGAPYLSASNANPLPVYTMDVGTLRLTSGELQLGVSGADPATGAAVFGIRGNVVNNGGTLLLGRRVTDGTTSVVQGINLRVDGNFTQAAGGTLSLAASPALVRQAGTQVGALPAAGVLGFGGYGVALTPFVPFDPLTTNQLRSTPSTLTVNGDLTLAGTVSIAAQPGAIYTAGRNADLITVSGTYNGSGLTVANPTGSPFVRFALTPRTVGSQTVVSVDVARISYASVASTTNAAAAATALDAAVPSVVARLRGIANPNAVTDVESYANIQDLATVISALDTRLTAAEASAVFTELSSASVYGSLSALSTTAAFGDPADAPVAGDGGVGLWFRPSGLFARYDGDSTTGAGDLRADNYGGALGFSVTTGDQGVIGIGGGYGRIDAQDRAFPTTISADTYMVGLFGRQVFRGFDLAVQGVFGWTNWDTVRNLPLLSRTARASFDSSEFRLTARVAYDFTFGDFIATPFGRLDMRRYDFEAFREQGAGGLGVAVASRKENVINPEAGLRIGGDLYGFRPFAEASYVFQGDVNSDRRVSYLGDPSNSFRLRGVDPEGYARLGAGINADFYGANFSLRGSYLTGGGNKAGEVAGAITFRF